MVTERMIINALIVGAAFILVPFVISSTLVEGNMLPALFFLIVTALVVAFFVLKDTLCVWPLLGGSISGALNFLPLPLEAPHVFCLLLIVYYVFGYVMVRQKKIKVGKPRFFWPIMTVTLILLYHNHSVVQGKFGGDTEGAKPAFMIYLAVLAYFCGINIKPPSVTFFSKIPWYAVLLSAASSVPFLLSTVIPGLAPILYHFTNSVNVDAYVTSVSGAQGGASDGVISRMAALGPVGMSLQLYLLCHYPMASWLRPERWWMAGLSLICFALVVASGFRNVLFSFAMLTMVATWCYYSWRSIFLPAFALIFVAVVLIGGDNGLYSLPVNKLPLIAQRTLSFLPGNWDEDALESSRSSNEFRKGIRDVYIKEYASRSPLFGNGFNINKSEFDGWAAAADGPGSQEDKAYYQSKMFIEGKLFHTGWISIYDIVGIVGSLGFIALAWVEIKMAGRFIFGPKADRKSVLHPLYIWIFCNLVTNMASFFLVFGDIKQSFVNLCVFAIVLSQLSDIENTDEIPIPRSDLRGSAENNPRAGVGSYGYYGRY